jgi:hypothetical protein
MARKRSSRIKRQYSIKNKKKSKSRKRSYRKKGGMERTRSPSPGPRSTEWLGSEWPNTREYLSLMESSGQSQPDLTRGPFRNPVTEEEICEYEILKATQSLRVAEKHLINVKKCKNIVNDKKVKKQLSEIRDVITGVGNIGKNMSKSTLSYMGEQGVNFAQNVGRKVGDIGNRYVFDPTLAKLKELSEYGPYDTPEKRLSRGQ